MELSVVDLGCARGGVPVLDGVSLRVGPGQALVLRGPNGIGKTTLLRTIAGLQRAISGRISLPPESLAFAGHLDGLKATLTVAENLGFWAAVHGRASISEAVAAMDLGDLCDRQAQNLSAGQKRRLGLARLMVTGRPIWLLDEPTVSLDTASVRLFAGMVRAHLAGGGAALIATHVDLGLAEAEVLDLSPFKARLTTGRAGTGAFDEALG